MKWRVTKSTLDGTIITPSSKSHTIRALLIATLAEGTSVIKDALLEGDGKSALDAAVALGAEIDITDGTLTLKGIGQDLTKGDTDIFMGNSGTGTRLFTTAAALGSKERTFDGDSSLRSRPMKPLLQAIKDLGGDFEIKSDNGHIPYTVKGPLSGGETTVDGLTSQYLSSLLLTTPLIKNDSLINVTNLHEKPYVQITLWWLDRMGVKYEMSEDMSSYKVFGGQKFNTINSRIPGDFSSATFGAVAACVTGTKLKIDNIDFTDPQGDKEIFSCIEKLGGAVVRGDGYAIVDGTKPLKGAVLDLNTMPDSLPAFSVLGCIAEGETRLVNVKQARIKETDRIAVMNEELSKMGADIEELEDGLVIRKSSLKGTCVSGHEDHRVVMALALAGMVSEGETLIDTAEAASVTYPTFARDFMNIGANITIED